MTIGETAKKDLASLSMGKVSHGDLGAERNIDQLPNVSLRIVEKGIAPKINGSVVF